MRALNAAFVLALAAPLSETLTDDVFEIPAHEWRYKDMKLERAPVMVRCSFHVESGAGAVRVVLVNAGGLDDWKNGNHEAGTAAGFMREGGFSRAITVPDTYAVIVENGGRDAASVRLRVTLDFSGRGQPQPRYLSARQRLAVILISAIVFLAIVGFSASKLLRFLRA